MEPARPKIPRNVLILAFVALASGFGQDLITPALPAYLLLIGASRADIGLIDGLLQGATSVFRFVSGVISDRFRNRKWLVFAGYTLSSISRPLLSAAGSIWPVAVLRTVDGVGKGTKDAPRDALIADSTADESQGRAFGFSRLVDTAGSVFGPLTAAALLFLLLPKLSTYRLIFALAAVPGLIALALIFLGVREPERPMKPAAVSGRRLPATFWIFTAATVVAMLTKINDSLFLTRAADIGVHRASIPLVFAGFTLVYALLSYPIGVWSDKIGKLPMLAVGWLVMAAVEFGFAVSSALETALVLFAFYGLFYALTEGSGRALIATLVKPESRGTAFAVFYTTTGLAVIAGGYGLGKVWDWISPQAAFGLSAAGSLVGFLMMAYLMLTSRKSGAPAAV